jgi:hypothetical protein
METFGAAPYFFRRAQNHSSALASSAGWIDDPCKRDDVLYKNILDKRFKYPDCLMVNHYVGHLKVNNGWFEDAARWAFRQALSP